MDFFVQLPEIELLDAGRTWVSHLTDVKDFKEYRGWSLKALFTIWSTKVCNIMYKNYFSTYMSYTHTFTVDTDLSKYLQT